ncbi:Nramp family divalent metal transporter [Virgisporangium ochraceum]|uniref:Nramp family divalent metal transporter n=1 Tax=Virgisporangium ochraceum TaxID=65505 RepID=UPI0019433507|nr:Nramp family divalent metal transporter [Virgisporangium ochraceum]
MTTRDVPDPPRSLWRVIGPGVVGAGVGLASGEFVLWPYIASQVGLVFLWAALVGIVTQWFINMEIERYTLATGETALTGFSRFWRHWGLVFAVMIYFANLWPGWVTSSATMVTYLFGGDVTWIAIGMLLVVGVTLTLAPVVYTALERVEFVKVGLVLLFIVVAVVFAISAEAWGELPSTVTAPEFPGEELGFALMLSALAFAGAGGGQNLCQSNWIRDKGYGLGAYVPRLVSPLTGKEEAAPASAGFIFEPTDDNLSRWRRWWKIANIEQAVTFAAISFITIVFMSMLAYSTVFGQEGLANSVAFLKAEGEALKNTVGPWFGTLFWVIGALSLFAAAMGIVDYTSRVAADVLKVCYLRQFSESKIYFGLVWGLVLIGCAILLLGFDQPLTLLVISACVGGMMMFVYSILLLVLNRKVLPPQIRIRSYRVAALVWAVLLFGVFSVLTLWQQVPKLFE